ncbi:hypothetical protein BDZ89DRAFT_626815 [Hymenopellis radicata]|nr:hypothetical protein BDZ89DRAFT_626815 [Hymenopellis radicata]
MTPTCFSLLSSFVRNSPRRFLCCCYFLTLIYQNSELEMTGTLYFCGILGASSPIEDDWMATEIAVAAALVENPATVVHLFSTIPFREFSGCSQDGFFKFGDDKADHLEVPVPNDAFVVIHRNGATLKDMFLHKISSITTHMKPSDKLIVFIAAHGVEEGDVMIGGHPLKISEVAHQIRNNATTILWSTICFSGKWLEGKVPWHGYVGAASNEESDSLVASDSNYHGGGVSILTTFATLAADQNAIIPLPYFSNSELPVHYFDQPTPIGDSIHRSLHQRAAQANETKKHLGFSYDGVTTADRQTQRPLPVPQLASEVLNRFRLVRQSHRAPPIPTTLSTSHISSQSTRIASFRRAIKQSPPMPGLEELLASGTQLLETLVSQAGLVTMYHRLQKPSLEENDLRMLCSAFNHRRQCRIAIERYIDWGGWKTTRPPQWDFSGGGAQAEQEMVDDDDKDTPKWREFFTWRTGVPGWRALTWTDIRQQLALAWEAAGEPRFSAADFLAVAGHMDAVQKEGILISRSPSFQAAVHYITEISHQDDSRFSAGQEITVATAGEQTDNV